MNMVQMMQSNMKLSTKGNKTEYEYDEESVYSSDDEYDSETLTDFEEEVLSKLPPVRKSLINQVVGCFYVQRAPKPVYIPAGYKYRKFELEPLVTKNVVEEVVEEVSTIKKVGSTKKWGEVSKNTATDIRYFPTISDALLIEKLEKSINKDEWIEVTVQKQQKQAKSEESEKTNIRTKLCQSVINKTECKHGKNCRFAHSESELTKKECSYGTRCSFVHLKHSGIYVNKKGRDRICMFSHPGESALNYIERITVKKDDGSTVVSSPVKSAVVTPKKPAVINVKEKVQPKPKVIKFKKENDETERIRKRNAINIEIRTVQSYIRQKESAFDRLSKVKSDVNKHCVDKLMVDIKVQKEKLKQLEKDYAYFSVVRKEVCDVVTDVTPITPIIVVEKQKSKSQLNAEKLNLLKKAEAEKKAAVVVCKKAEPVKESTIGFSYAKIVGPAEEIKMQVPISDIASVKSIENVVSNSDRDDAFNILKDKTKISNTLLKTKLCMSVSKGVKCQYGSKCKFAHDSSELSISKCLFGSSCIFVENTNGVYRNKLGKKICEHSHPNESESNFYLRIGIKSPVKKIEVKPEVKKNTFSMKAAPWAPKKETTKEEKIEVKETTKEEKVKVKETTKEEKVEVKETTKEDGWVEVKSKKETKKQVVFKTRMCNNIMRLGSCRYSDCKYAHSPSEIMICNFDNNCKYKNTTCYRIHSCESDSQFLKRIQNM